MAYKVRNTGDYAIVELTGDVDLERSPDVRKLLLEQIGAGHAVIVDLSGVSYIDSSGVAAAAMRVLELARLDKIFTIHASVDAVTGG